MLQKFIYTQRISDLGLRIAECVDYQWIPQSAIPNPQSVVYIIDLDSLQEDVSL